MRPKFFRSPDEFRAWLEQHYATACELVVGFHKRATGRPSLTWPQSVDEALCFGWIDGVRRRIDGEAYSIRFTPRRRGSIWSAVNTKRVAVLTREGRMHEAGLKAFRERDPRKTNQYSFEREAAALPPHFERRFRANTAAWRFFESTPPSYRRVTTFWIVSAKQESTRERRLAALMSCCARGERMDFMRPGRNSR